MLIPPALRRELRAELYQLEDAARALLRRVSDEIGPECRDDLRYINAKGEVFFSSLDDLIHFDPSERSAAGQELRALRRETDELILRRAEIDRKLRDARTQAQETEEDVRVERANRHAEALKVEIARLDGPVG